MVSIETQRGVVAVETHQETTRKRLEGVTNSSTLRWLCVWRHFPPPTTTAHTQRSSEISKAFASLQAIPMENPPAWLDAKPITLFGDFEREGDSFVARCLIPGDCPDNGVCSLKAPAGGGQPNFSMARTRHIQKHHAAGKKRAGQHYVPVDQ